MKKSLKISHYVSIIAVLALVPIIILGIFLANNFITKGQELRQHYLNLTDEAAEELSSYLTVHRLAMATLANQAGQWELTENQLAVMAREVTAQYPGFQEIYLSTPRFQVSTARDQLSAAEKQEMQQLVNLVLDQTSLKQLEKPYLSPQVSWPQGQQTVFFTAPILDSAKNLQGYIVGILDRKAFVQILSQFKIYSSGHAALVDNLSRVIIYTSESPDSTQAASPIWTALQKHADGTMDFYPTEGGSKEIVSYHNLADLGWGLWVAAPDSEVMKPLRQAAMISIGFLLLGVAVILFISRILIMYITKPLTILNLASQELAAGNLSFRVILPEDYPEEIKILGHRFNQMAANLEQTNKLLTIHNTEMEARVRERTSELLLKNKGLSALYAVASLVTSKDTRVTVMLSTALKKAMNLFGAEVGGVYLERSELGRLSYTVKRRFPGDETDEKYVCAEIYESYREGSQSKAAKLKTVTLPHAKQKSRIATVAIPNLINNLGAIALTRTEPWKEEELAILQAMCKQLGVVVSNLSMFRYINDQNSTLLAVMKSIHEGLILYNAKGGITFANPVFLELFHLQGFDCTGMSVRELKDREDSNDPRIKQLIYLWENFIQDIGYGQKELSFTLNEKAHHYRTDYFPVSSGEGFIGFGCLVRDITKEKEVELLKNTILSTVSHELRTPLTTIRGSAESLLRKDVQWSGEDQDEFLKAILEETQRLGELIDNIMDMSKIEAGALNLDIQAVDVTRVISRVTKRFQLRFPEAVFNLEIKDPLPMALIDKGRIDQVLSNIVENGIKYSSEKAVITISTRYLAKERKLEIKVCDQGIGIDSQHHQEIFTRFYRIKNTMSKNIIGSGVGLSITKGIIEAHGGSIRLESELGMGSCFYVTLPCEEYKEEL